MSSDDYQQEIQYLKQRLSFDNDQRDSSIDLLQTDDKIFDEIEENFRRLYDRLNEIRRSSMSFHPVLKLSNNYLKPNENRQFVELAIQARCNDQIVHVWPLKNFDENHLDESFRLIGVANIYLIGLFSCSKVDYTVPIINTDGKISGSLHVALDHVGLLSMERTRNFQINSMTTISEIDRESVDEGIEDTRSLFNEKNDQITIKFTLKEIRDVTIDSDEPLICHFTFINPKLDQTIVTSSYDRQTKTFAFDNEQNNEYTFQITNSFLDKCLNNAISVEISQRQSSRIIDRPISSSSSLIDRLIQSWRNVKRYIQFSIEIQELNSIGQWTPVEIDNVPGILTGGVYRLKQGQTKRLSVQLHLLPQPSTLSLIIENIQNVQIGSIHRRRVDAPNQLDSYTEHHLDNLRSQWYRLIDEEKSSLEDEIQELHCQHSYHSIERQSQILHQLVQLAEERNLLEFPPIRSGLPGSPAGWIPPPSIEMHRPMLFLSSSIDEKDLMEEDRNDMLTLPIIHHSNETSVIAQWNPSIHDAIVINQCTPNDSIVYLIVRITVTISEPIRKELIFRKRIAVTISKGETWWNVKSLKSWMNAKSPTKTSVVYELISEIPKNIHGEQIKSTNLLFDDVQRLARRASQIDRLILVDRLRQEVLLSEKCPLIRQSLQHRHRTLSSSSLSSLEHDLTIGDRVLVNTGHQIINELAHIRYIGDFHLHQGIWYGIELDHPIGKHNGKLDGRIYFQCQDQHGLFVRREKLSKWQ